MPKKTILGLTTAALFMTAATASAAEYKIDKEGQHAFVQFRIKHLGYSWLYGSFKDFDGGFTFDEADTAKDKVNVTINTASVDTNHANVISICAAPSSSTPPNSHRRPMFQPAC